MNRYAKVMLVFLVAVIMFLSLAALSCFASNYHNLKSNNTNNNGYIFVGTGSTQGGVQIGHWTDPSTIPTLKGDKGDKGDTGAQGIQGLQGVGIQGIQGFNGNDGYVPIKGVDYFDGQEGYTPIKGVDYFDGVDGLDGKDVDLTTILNLQNEDIALQNNIDIEAMARQSSDTILQTNINNEITNRTTADTKEKRARIHGDKRLQKNINNEAITRGTVDTLLQTNINAVDIDSRGRDITLQNNVNSEALARFNGDNALNSRINDTNTRVDDVSNRVSKLERTQFVLETSFRVLDTQRISLRPFFRQNFTAGKIDVVGLKIDVKLGKSYEEKLIAKVNARLDAIEKTIGKAPVIERVVDERGNTKSITINGGGLVVSGQY